MFLEQSDRPGAARGERADLEPRRVRLSRLSLRQLLRGCFAVLLLLIAMLLASLAWMLR